MKPLIAFQDPFGQLPTPASTFAGDVDGLFNFMFGVSLFFFGLILAILVYSAVVYRRKTDDQLAASNVTHNTGLEVVWTLIPTVIVMVIFAWGWKGNLDQQKAPADALGYNVQGYKWAWKIWHPGMTGASDFAANEMWVPVNQPVRVTLTSEDVLHSFYVPAFRQKRDLVPGLRQLVWFQPTRVGDYDLFCAEYCGDQHSAMRGVVHVVSEEEYAAAPWKPDIPEDPVARGEYWYKQIGCMACHSVDGSKLVGPTYKGIWGRKGRFTDGTEYVVDRDYVYESIREPMKHIVEGYPPGMAPYSAEILPDEAIDDIIAWFKSEQLQ